ncbi:MAG: hypothetical protein EP318_09705 [Rhodobacteraceae bacterium]|nr:MAG: hypothetical protein EP318_09705 [Paracoccaceae bacterium]
MSAPDTNLEKQKRRHKGPLAGIKLGLAVVALLFAGFLVWTFAQSDGPEGAETQIDGRTGAETGSE